MFTTHLLSKVYLQIAKIGKTREVLGVIKVMKLILMATKMRRASKVSAQMIKAASQRRNQIRNLKHKSMDLTKREELSALKDKLSIFEACCL